MKDDTERTLIINSFSEQFVALFKNEAPCAGIYQVGSSVSKPQKSNDLDILIVGSENETSKYKSKINVLRERIFQNNAVQGSFDASNKRTKSIVNSIVVKLARKFKTQIHAEYVVGPTKPRRDSFSIHICGPMPLCDFQYFFELFPFHALAFFAQNNPLLGPNFGNLFMRPSPSLFEYKEWQSSNYKRFLKSASEADKIKCLKKILLTKFLYTGTSNPYEKVVRELMTLNKFHGNTIADLIDKCIFRFQMT